jgi:hypothetical protein
MLPLYILASGQLPDFVALLDPVLDQLSSRALLDVLVPDMLDFLVGMPPSNFSLWPDPVMHDTSGIAVRHKRNILVCLVLILIPGP